MPFTHAWIVCPTATYRKLNTLFYGYKPQPFVCALMCSRVRLDPRQYKDKDGYYNVSLVLIIDRTVSSGLVTFNSV